MYTVDKGYLKVHKKNVDEVQTVLMSPLDMKLYEDYWMGKDDAVRRSMLGFPLDIERRETSITKDDIRSDYPFLRDFQVDDVYEMIIRGNVLNANTMGLGKTLETIVVLEYLQCDQILIICPKSVRGSWRNELIKWLNVPEDNIQIIKGTPKQRMKQAEDLKKYNIINYELLRDDQSEFNKIMRRTQWDAVVADEAHRIKNRDTKQTKGVKRLKTHNRIALTGTPVQNKPNDLYSILQWINPFYSGGSYWRFTEIFCEVVEDFFGPKIMGLTKHPRNIDALGIILDDVMIRRVNDASLPDSLIIPVSLEMSNTHRKLYKQITEEILIELESSDDLYINSALTRLIRLQQCTSNPGKFEINENPKFQFISDLIEDNPDKKIVVFSRFKETINSLDELLKGKSITLTGDTEDRDANIKAFQTNKDIRAFLATIGAGGEGVNGLQDVADIMVFIDKDWSPAKNEQARGRLVRQGQDGEIVKIYELSLEGTIDNKVEQVLGRKVSDIVTLLRD